MSLIPNLDASIFASGLFPLSMLPVLSGVGPAHAPGLIPDPGLNGDPNDYLGRDGKWKPFTVSASYQPTLPDVSITVSPSSGVGHGVVIRTIAGAVLFYRVNGAGPFIEVHASSNADNKISLTLDDNDFVEAYAAKAGYNNSAVSAYVVATPAPGA